MTIWKYNVTAMSPLLKMPKGARLVHIEHQGTIPTLWAIVDPEQPRVYRNLGWYSTGSDPIPEDGIYVGTLLFENGVLVYHLFDFGESAA